MLKQPIQGRVLLYKISCVLNIAVIGILLLLPIYIKFGSGLQPEDWRRSEDVIRLFGGTTLTWQQPLNGSLSTFSDAMWVMTTAICFFSFLILSRLRPYKPLLRFLFFSFLLTLLWTLDDAFNLAVILKMTVGIPKEVRFVTYLPTVLVYVKVFAKQLRQTPYGLLIIFVLLMIGSNLVELLPLNGHASLVFFEEGAELLALTNLVCYFWWVCDRNIIQAARIKLESEV